MPSALCPLPSAFRSLPSALCPLPSALFRRLLSAFCLLPSALCPLLAQDGGKTSGPVIDSIVIVNHDVFDPDEARSSAFFRIANALHFTTRPYVIQRELLFEVGDRYDSARVEESLRNLRTLGIFRDVVADTVQHGDSVTVYLRTGDGWSTDLNLNGRSTGGTFSWSAGLLERNVLGSGAWAGITYRKEPDRTAVTLLGRWDRPLGSRLSVAGLYDDLSDGEVGQWAFARPFRALEDRAAFELQGAAARRDMLQFRNGQLSQVFRRRFFYQRGTFAYAPVASPGGYVRLSISGQVKREEYFPKADSLSAIPDTVTGSVGFFADLNRARYKVTTHYIGFDRDVDIDLSTRLLVGMWLAPTALGYDRGGIGPRGFFQTGAILGKQWMRFSAQANGLFTSAGLDSGQVWAGFTLVSQALRKSATVFHVEAMSRKGTPPGQEIDLGHGIGPRAFDVHAFTGERAVWGSIEHRAFVIDELFNLLGVGFAGFVDYGGAWYPDQPARFGGDIGAGIRFGATRSSGPNVGRLDVAYRFGDGFEGRRWVVVFGRGFFF
jgi:hypothetical protein